MPDNHFENQVKQTLDELNFIPSEAVWQKVEKQIKKEDDRMRFLLWLPLLCLFLGGAIWFLLPEKTGSTRVHSPGSTILAEKDKPPAKSGRSMAGIEEGSADRVKAGNTQPTPAIAKKNMPTAGKTDDLSGRISATPLTKESNETGHSPAAAGSAVAVENHTARAANEISTPTAHDPQSVNSTFSQVPGSGLSADKETQKTAAVKADHHSSGQEANSTTDSVDQHKTGSEKTKLADSLKAAVAKKTKSPGKSKIQWAAYGSGGISSFFLQSPTPPLAYSAPGPVGSYSRPGGGYPSHRASFAFQLGLVLQKTLTKTTQITAGIGFTHAAASIKRGALVTQSVAFYSANATPQMAFNYYAAAAPQNSKYNYTQHYDFIEIPLGIEKRISPQSRFSLNAGLSVGWLLSTNALQYDQQTGIYYRNDSYFNKTQLDISGGFQYRILQRGAFILKLGPQVQYGLTGLLNKKSPYKEHLFLGGLRLVLVSNRK